MTETADDDYLPARIIARQYREIERLRAENENLLLFAQMACSKCRQNVHLKRLERTNEQTVDLATLKPIKDADRVENVEAALNEQSIPGWRCPDCGQRFMTRNIGHVCDPNLPPIKPFNPDA